jgi:hypothetical protein
VYGYGASGRGPGSSKHGDQAVLDDILEFYHYSAENGDVNAQVRCLIHIIYTLYWEIVVN